MKMMEVEVETIAVVERTDIAQQLLALQVTDIQQLETRIAAAIADRLDGLRESTRADLMASQQATDRLTEMALTQALSEMLDPTRQVTAGGLDATESSALDDVTKSRAAEQALRDQRTAEIVQNAVEGALNCLSTRDAFADQLRERSEQIIQLGAAGTVDLLRSLGASPLEEQLQTLQVALDARNAASEAARVAEKAIVDERAIVVGLNRPGISTVQDLMDKIALAGDSLDLLTRKQEVVFDWERSCAIIQLEQMQNALLFDVRLAMGLLHRAEEASAGAQIVEPTGRARISPVGDESLVPGTAAGDLVAKEIRDGAKAAVLNQSSLSELVEYHAEGRFAAVYGVLDQIAGMKDANLVKQGDPAFVGGPATYQLGKGSRADMTEAAHELPAQVYVGIGEDQFSRLAAYERSAFRLDKRISDDSDLATLARFQAAGTNVVPAFVNDVDSVCEERGLRRALQTAIETLIDQDSANLRALEQAYEVFRAEAAKALDSARDYYNTMPADEAKRQLEVVDSYRRMLDQVDANRARDLMFEWIEQSKRFSRGPESGSR
jgi:hypothetical protein